MWWVKDPISRHRHNETQGQRWGRKVAWRSEPRGREKRQSKTISPAPCHLAEPPPPHSCLWHLSVKALVIKPAPLAVPQSHYAEHLTGMSSLNLLFSPGKWVLGWRPFCRERKARLFPQGCVSASLPPPPPNTRPTSLNSCLCFPHSHPGFTPFPQHINHTGSEFPWVPTVLWGHSHNNP